LCENMEGGIFLPMAGWRADFSRRRTVVSRVGSRSIVVNPIIISMASVGRCSFVQSCQPLVEVVLHLCNMVPIFNPFACVSSARTSTGRSRRRSLFNPIPFGWCLVSTHHVDDGRTNSLSRGSTRPNLSMIFSAMKWWRMSHPTAENYGTKSVFLDPCAR
jgi:hypothetical protein